MVFQPVMRMRSLLSLWVGQPRTEVSFRTSCGFDEITTEGRRGEEGSHHNLSGEVTDVVCAGGTVTSDTPSKWGPGRMDITLL